MPVLGGYETERLYLPSTKDATDEAERSWVVIKKKYHLKDAKLVNATDGEEIDKICAMIAAGIVDWNFTKPDGTPVDINDDSVANLELEDFAYLAEVLGRVAQESFKGLSTEEKKESSPSSTQESEVKTISPTIS